MSDPINANPTVLDVSQLPTRGETLGKASKSNAEETEESLIYSNLFNFSLLSTVADKSHYNDYNDLLLPELTDDDLSSLSSADDVEETEQRSVSHLEAIDPQEIYDLIATICDPEHPLTLGQLGVVNLADIKVTDPTDKTQIAEVLIRITPTITHCSLATLIGLGIRVRLDRCLPQRFRIVILLKEGSHQSENQVNKQLNDKERVSAACENEQLLKVISHMFSTCQ
ncbi:hypothetical protein CANARDRAFT_28752 [[Candida] arabinofermentans NRRL YB-2248]|uniref:MIP18 family-like domain-containing protein n=1 Tax=[Candida] arabinofermentans NRRL YB-2248 TaxID=983967 RepID=A0A1E4SZZ7_9ASCO|nr:hypothetical protein CANARDRAFT_28752 [[Candida] arabinofermentans NRRL YB-2248]